MVQTANLNWPSSKIKNKNDEQTEKKELQVY